MTAPRKEVIGNAEPRITAIYALCEFDETPRYVGKTVQYLHQRHKEHIGDAKRGGKRPVNRWLRKRMAANQVLTIKLLEYVPPHSDWAARERAWILKFRAEGHDLLNLTEGGEGLAGHKFSAEHRAKLAAAIKTGANFACETCGATFWRKRSEIERGDCRFCSRACYALSLKGVSRPMSPDCIRRGVAAAADTRRARTHCKRHHLLAGDNLYLNTRGARVCKECRKLHKAKHRSRACG